MESVDFAMYTSIGHNLSRLTHDEVNWKGLLYPDYTFTGKINPSEHKQDKGNKPYEVKILSINVHNSATANVPTEIENKGLSDRLQWDKQIITVALERSQRK